MTSKQKLRNLGVMTIVRIADIAKVTPRLLASTVCLSLPSTFSRETFYHCYASLKQCLSPQRLSDSKGDQLNAFWQQGINESWIIQVSDGLFKLEPSIRIKLDYHRQCILHFFAEIAIALDDKALNSILSIEFPFLQKLTPIQCATDLAKESILTHVHQVFFNTIKIHEVIKEMGTTVPLEKILDVLRQKYADRPELGNRVMLQNTIDAIKKTTPVD